MTVETVLEQSVASVRSVERTFDLLSALEAANRPLRVAELAASTSMPRATVKRLLAVLEKREYVRREHGRYQLWVASLPLTSAFLLSNNLIKSALPVVQELAANSQETASLWVRLGFDRVVVLRVEGLRPLRYVTPIGQRLPLHLGVGKVIAAAMRREELDQMLDSIGEIKLATGATVTREQLLSDLEHIRQQGYAVSVDEIALGTVNVTAPVTDPNGVTSAALSVVGAVDRMPPEKTDHLSVDVRNAAQAISARYSHL